MKINIPHEELVEFLNFNKYTLQATSFVLKDYLTVVRLYRYICLTIINIHITV